MALQSAEIVARICPRLGDLGCHYAQQLVPIILQLAQRETVDSLIIASALSAGADLLPLLGFYIHDIQVKTKLTTTIKLLLFFKINFKKYF